MPDADPVNHLVIGHLQAALKVVSFGVPAKLLSVCSICKVQLDGANSIVDPASDPVEESLGHLDRSLVRDQTVEVLWELEDPLFGVVSAETKFSQCAEMAGCDGASHTYRPHDATGPDRCHVLNA